MGEGHKVPVPSQPVPVSTWLEMLQGAQMQAQQAGGCSAWKEPSAAGNIWKHSWENVLVQGMCCWTPGAVGDPHQGEDTTEGVRLSWGYPWGTVAMSDPAEGENNEQGSSSQEGQGEAARTELLLETNPCLSCLGRSCTSPWEGRDWKGSKGAGHNFSLGSWEERLSWVILSFSQHKLISDQKLV